MDRLPILLKRHSCKKGRNQGFSVSQKQSTLWRLDQFNVLNWSPRAPRSNGVLKMWLGWSIITGGIGMFYRPTHNDTVDYFCGDCQNKVATSHPDKGPMETFGPGGHSRTFDR